MNAPLHDLTEKVARVSEIYAKRFSIRRDADWHILKLQEELGELVAEHLRLTQRGRVSETTPEAAREALANETADLFAHLMLFAQANSIDLEAALARKWFKYLPENEANAENV